MDVPHESVSEVLAEHETPVGDDGDNHETPLNNDVDEIGGQNVEEESSGMTNYLTFPDFLWEYSIMIMIWPFTQWLYLTVNKTVGSVWMPSMMS